ncbi:TPA: sce7726 family protein [Yersinia enterocolitica]|nr:sce7726 family protein [Yersinia enterocolitica]
MKELELKIKLIDFILKEFNDVLISSEFRFDFGSRRADVISLKDDIAIVFEIKSAKDSVERLQYQMQSYVNYFDFCYVVCVNENITAVRKHISKSIGIILISGNSVRIIRKAYQFRKQNKLSLCSTIPTSDLKKLTRDKKIRSKYELCLSVSVCNPLDKIKKLSRIKLKEKIIDNFSIFNSELGKVITPDDILTLTRVSSGEIL